jgi:hypothetical protein
MWHVFRGCSRGENVEVLTPLVRELPTDARRCNLMPTQEGMGRHTVLMMQVENEVGLLGASRDHSPAAEAAFAQEVPAELMRYFQEHEDNLIPEFKKYWEAAVRTGHGRKSSARGGRGVHGWHTARYLGQIAAGSRVPCPVLTLGWSNEGQKVQYPSAVRFQGAGHVLPHPRLSPDIYLRTSAYASYTRSGSAVYPESTAPGEGLRATGSTKRWALSFDLSLDHPSKTATNFWRN